MNRFELIIFDCDGTLVDSRTTIVRTMMEAFTTMGLPHPSENEIASLIGLALPDAFRLLLPHHDEETRKRGVDLYRFYYQKKANAGELQTELFPDVEKVLRVLEERSILLAIATGKSFAGLQRTLRDHQLGAFFPFLQTVDSAPSKPDPGMIENILQQTNIAREKTLMVGDTDYDILMGKRAQVPTCAVTYGCHSESRLREANPDFVIHHFADLLTEIDSV
ncbi:HAD family hydrolase [Magnetococcales bacterium HHB-1]